MLTTDRLFEALVLRNRFTDFVAAIDTKKLIPNQKIARAVKSTGIVPQFQHRLRLSFLTNSSDLNKAILLGII
jgi:hypothetical protein